MLFTIVQSGHQVSTKQRKSVQIITKKKLHLTKKNQKKVITIRVNG